MYRPTPLFPSSNRIAVAPLTPPRRATPSRAALGPADIALPIATKRTTMRYAGRFTPAPSRVARRDKARSGQAPSSADSP